jgi:hypothetical protein
MGEVDEGSRRTGSLCGNTLEDIVDKRIENGHGLVRDTSIRVDLLQHYQVSESAPLRQLTMNGQRKPL